MLVRRNFVAALCICLQIVNISCDEGGSLAFVIDDTASMGDDIKYVKKEAREIMKLVMSKKSDIKELVLVTFNDPGINDVQLRTGKSMQHTFINKLNSIRPHGGGDCPEMAVTGIEEALKNTRQGSYIYVFTDANAKDYYNLSKVQNLCQKKQSQVVIVYSEDNYCFQPSGYQFNVYYDIAKACSGQVFIVKKDQVHSVLKTIETLLQGKNAIFKWITVPRTSTFVHVEFTLDEKAEYAVVSTSGTNVDLRITNNINFLSPEVASEKTMWNTNGKVVRLINPNPGTYYAWVKGDSTISVLVYGRTDFTFEHGFSILKPKFLTDTAKQPIAGLEQHLSINVTDPDNSVNIQTAQILDIRKNDYLITELPLRNIGKNFYITDGFVSPNFEFRIAVKGEIKTTSKKITRFSKNIMPRIVDLIPESLPDVNIDEGMTVYVNYGSAVTLRCKVTAHPPPKIEWYTSSGLLLQSKSSVIDDPLFVSYLKLENIKQSESYVCKASNKKGSGKDKRIKVNVKPIFTITGEAVYNTKYGADAKIPCDIKSYLPTKIKWFKNGKQLSDNSEKHTISPDGSVLTLKAMDIPMQGKYTCEATLNSDATIKQTRDRDVQITGLVYPKITFATTILKDKHLTTICRVAAVPKPIISWQFKPKGSDVFSVIRGSGEEMHIPDIRLKDTGVYKCIATNALGKTEHNLDVVVEERPVILNEETTIHGVEGDLVMKISCNVTGFPEPTIVWKKGNNVIKMESKYKIKGNILYINKPIQSDSAEYTCEAKNKLGVAMKMFVVEIVDNFEEDENFNGNTHDIYAEQGKSKTIKCNLKHIGEDSVRWYVDGILKQSTGSTFTIKSASISDEKNYTCRVNTDEGSISETYVMYVGYAPIFDDNSPSLQIVNWQEIHQKLDCMADSQPPAKYQWLRNGKIIESDGNDLGQKPITDWGEYTCKVSNEFGNIQKTFKVISSGCYVTKNIATKNQPIISHAMKPTWPLSLDNTGIPLKENEEVKLSCSHHLKSKNNFKTIPDKHEVLAKCNTQDKFTVDGKTYRYADLQCSNKVEPSVLATHKQCFGPNSEMIRVGFEVNGFIDVYKVCYDRRLNVPLYASASPIIPIKTEEVQTSEFEWSSASELGHPKPGNWKPTGSCKCCFTQGQLVNVNELAFGPAQAASFKDNLNSIPIWNPSCDNNRMSWQTFDDQTRAILASVNKASWTGASGYAPKDGGLVPRYIWKVLQYDEEPATVAVYVNDQSLVEKDDIRCFNSCELIIDTDRADKFLYCCNLEEFSQKFGVPLDTIKDLYEL